MQTIDFGSNEKFIANYEKLKSSRKMGELYGCDKTSVLNHAKKIGYNVNGNKKSKLSLADKQDIINAYYDKTSTQLAQEYGVSRGVITKIWYDANLKGKANKPTNGYNSLNLSGQKINSLTVLERTEHRDSSGCVKWLCRCDCGKIVEVSSSRLNTKAAKSCGCLSKKALDLGRGLNFHDLKGQIFGKLTVLNRCEDKKLNDRVIVQWLCVCTCGRETKVLASNLISGNTQSCGLCGEKSHGNLKIDSILTQAGIPFEREKRFSTCKDEALLPFDFFVNNQYLIEYDGEQHFNPNSFFYSEKIQKHDEIKNQWCKENHIPLIRIPYTHYPELALTDLLLETSPFILKTPTIN